MRHWNRRENAEDAEPGRGKRGKKASHILLSASSASWFRVFRVLSSVSAITLIRVIGVIVPQRLRADWRQEWEAELRFREQQLLDWNRIGFRSRLELLRHSLGAFTDALLIQPRRLEDEMFQDLRYGLRVLLKKPGFAMVAITTLALGIGANTGVFSVVNAVLLNPYPYHEPDKLVVLARNNETSSFKEIMAYPVYLGVREQGRSFEDLAAFRPRTFSVSGSDGPEMIWGARVTSSFFSVLGVAPQIGRAFLPGEDQPNGPKLVILSHGLWQRRFGGDPNIVGQTLAVEKESVPSITGESVAAEREFYQIVGVMPTAFKFNLSSAAATEFWTPLEPNPRAATWWNIQELVVLGRLKPEATLDAARAELSVVGERLRQSASQGPYKLGDRFSLSAMTLRDYFVGDTRKPLLILLGAVGFVLLIACVNVANLLLAHGVGRQKEVAIRAVLGAGRHRLIRQMLTESLLLALAGGLVGWLLLNWSLQAIAWALPKEVVRIEDLSLDWKVFTFTLGVSLMTGLIFGLVPAWRASRPDLQTALKLGNSTSGEALFSFRNLLVVAEVAMALVLLAGAGLMINSFVKLTNVDAGFKAENVVSLQLNLLSRQSAPERIAFADELLAGLRATPGVVDAGLIDHLPIGRGWVSQTNKRSKVLAPPFAGNPDEELEFEPRVATPGYFATMGIRLLKGRLFNDADNGASQPVIVVSETVAQKFWPGEDPLGKMLAAGSGKKQTPIVIGVVSDIRHHHLNRAPTPILYSPFNQEPDSHTALAVRTSSDPAGLIPHIRSRILAVDRRVVVSDVMTMKERMSELVAEPRFYTLLLGWFGMMGLLLAVIGLYGVISYTVSQRTREMGIRLALGAQRGDILKLVIGHGSVLTLTGLVLGLAGAAAVTRVLDSQLFGVGATDALTFISVAILLTVVSLLACWVPARRAMRVDPVLTFRQE